MKILYYSSHPNLNLASPSGYGTHMREMIEAFEKLGHEVLPVILGGTSINGKSLDIKRRSVWKAVASKLIPKYLWETAKDFKLLRFDEQAYKILDAAIQEFQPNIIYERAAFMQLSGVQAAKFHKVKHVLEMNSPYVEERQVLQGKSYLLKKAEEAEEKQLTSSDKIVVVSSALQEFFKEKYLIEEKRFLITPNAVNLNKIEVNDKRVAAIREKYTLNSEHIVIGFVGSIFPWHGVDLQVLAFKELLQNTGKDIRLLIVGDGETLPAIKSLADNIGISDKIIFTGNVPHKEVYNYIELMDICVMAKSNWYGSPVKIFEYGAMGKAVIAPDTSPVKDVCKHMENAVLVQPTSDSIYDALKLLLTDQQLRETVAGKFKDQVLSQHTWLKNAEKVLTAIA